MDNLFFKQAILCLMFAMAEADGKITNDELVSLVTMKDLFRDYDEADVMALYHEYRSRFANIGFSEICNVMVRQIQPELHMGALSYLADAATVDFDVDIKEGSFISIAANAMGISDTAVKTLLLSSLSKKLMQDIAC
jgi:uncharacterized tellurite resistance protein B-like protein